MSSHLIKLGVEVTGAHDLLSKENGGSNPFVEIHFDGQKFRTAVKDKDLNPVWNEHFYFNISDPTTISDETLEAYVYHQSRSDPKKKVCLGKVRLAGTSFVTFSESVLLHYPLERPGLFSRARGELGLRVFMTSDPYLRSSNPVPSMESSMVDDLSHGQRSERVPGSGFFSGDRAEKRRTFRNLPNKGSQPSEQIPQQQMNMNYGMGPRVVYSGQTPQPMDYSIKETSPNLGGGRVVGGRVIPNNLPTSTYDLVEMMQYLFIRVVKARDLPNMDVTGALDPYVEVKMGNYKGKTKCYEKTKIPEWNEVFAFSSDQRQAHVLEVVVKNKEVLVDDFVGRVVFDLHEIPTRVPPDSPLAPQWYRLEDKNGEKVNNGELMVAVWNGTQADEAFPDAIHTNAAVPDDMHYSYQAHIRSKVYQSPRMWYLRVNVLSAQDLVVSEKTRFPEVFVKVQIGNQVYRTKTIQTRNMNPIWNDEMMLVAAEPFEEHLVLTVEDRVGPNKDDMLGKVVLPLSTVQKRVDDKDKGRRAQWYSMEKSTSAALDGDHLRKDKFFSRLQLMVSLEGGYHVLDESTHYSSDLRPTARQLWKSSIGVLEVGILSAEGFQPMKTRDGRGTSDTFCVAKYGHKWVRTRTVLNSLSPKYNEQYTWEVYDPATVLTLGVFDNGQIGSSNGGNKDTKIGKVRVRISTLETGRVYTHSYPLLVLHPSGVKKMGELHLAIRFSCSSMISLMTLYSKPLLPKMHYVRPLSVMQQENLRIHAVGIVAARMARTEPPLKREVVEYMSDVHSHLWSMRRSKAHFFRLTNVFSSLISVGKWFGEVCEWKNPVTTALMHLLLALLVYFPELILPTAFLYMCLIGIWNYYYRPKYPPHMNTRISHADAVHPDELDEEFDTFPTSRSSDIVKVRYDRLRHLAGKIQSVVGDIASQGERVQNLLSWRDTRASAIFILFCFGAAIFLYVTPFQLLSLIGGSYVMRHPRFRRKMPSVPLNFFRRLPARTDSLL